MTYINSTYSGVGLIASLAGSQVTVTNTVPGETAVLTAALAPIIIDMDAGVTVQWEANVSGPVNNYLLLIKGGGTFRLANCTITNSGTATGGAICSFDGVASSPRTTIEIGANALVRAERTGNPILIASNNVTLTVQDGGTVESSASNGNAAIQIGSGSATYNLINVTGTIINISGEVNSINGGYAINDSAGTGNVDNNTTINVSMGEVTAGTACAIISKGTASTVSIAGGVISNAAGNNANPAIYMSAPLNGNPQLVNVTVTGGTVQSTSLSGYAVQTAGSLNLSGGTLLVNNGRAVNLIGDTSEFRMSGGVVQGSGANVVSTATENTTSVSNAKVFITGGSVKAVGTSGNAINITGANSSVSITGGSVTTVGGNAVNASGSNSIIDVRGNSILSSESGNAIYCMTSASSASVTIGGTSKVYSSRGNAVYTLGSNTSVSIIENARVYSEASTFTNTSGKAIISTGTTATVSVGGTSQVWAFNTGNAIRVPNGTVTLTSGFVFAYGPSATNVISAGNVQLSFIPPAVSCLALVVAWDRDTGDRVYQQGGSSSHDIDLSSAYNGQSTDFFWHNSASAAQAGINYTLGTNTGFFPLVEVTVVRDYGWIIDPLIHAWYQNIDRSGIPGGANLGNSPQNDYSTPTRWSWPSAGRLLLNNFSWTTTAPTPLTVYDSAVRLDVFGSSINTFASVGNNPEGSYGILSEYPLTITGSGTLVATGGASSLDSYGINSPQVIIETATVIARGNNGAFGNTFSVSDPILDLPECYTYWASSSNSDPGGMGNVFCNAVSGQYGMPYAYNPNDKFVKIIPGPFIVVNDSVIDGFVSSTLESPIITPVLTLYGTSWQASIAPGSIITSWFTNLPSGLTVSVESIVSDSLTLYFSGTPTIALSAPINIMVPGSAFSTGEPLSVLPNPRARYDIHESYTLSLIAEPGGTISGTPSGRYFPGAVINVAAAAENGFMFTGWIEEDTRAIANSSSNSANFMMPAHSVTLTAGFKPVAMLEARKTITGTSTALTAGQFSFAVFDGDNQVATGTNDASGLISFSPITYNCAGTYNYRIVETSRSDSRWMVDNTEFLATVIVTDEHDDGEFITSIFYADGVIPEFINQYRSGGSYIPPGGNNPGSNNPPPPETTVTLRARKNVSGEGAQMVAGQFTFAVYEGDNRVATGSNDASGNVIFTPLAFTKAGTYTYRIVETTAAGDGWTMDGRVFTAAITLSGSGDKMTASIAYAGGAIPTFINHFESSDIDKEPDENPDGVLPGEEPGDQPTYPPVEITLTAQKIVTGPGARMRDGQFSFSVFEGENLVATGSNDEAGRILFTPISYNKPGTHTYYLTENDSEGSGYRTDLSEFTVRVIVSENAGVLSTALSYASRSLPLFVNEIIEQQSFFVSEHNAYISGYPDGTVAPQRNISRAEVAAIFTRLLTEEVREKFWTVQKQFPDVDETSWYAEAVTAMHNLQVLSGYPDGSFKPQAAITRGELAAMVARFAREMQMLPHEEVSFNDISAHWASADIAYVAAIGWVGGYPDGTYRPDQQITRAEFIVLTNRMLHRVPETIDDLLIDSMIHWSDNADPDAWYYLAIQEATNTHDAEYKDKVVPGLLFCYEHWVGESALR
ncbi:MAG: S-layer homology domain-containing protein [Symbiobacteriaceae bacterium]|nr:S-layer homology domain-containing protein [Symbiobacteriaceae bacterium]